MVIFEDLNVRLIQKRRGGYSEIPFVTGGKSPRRFSKLQTLRSVGWSRYVLSPQRIAGEAVDLPVVCGFSSEESVPARPHPGRNITRTQTGINIPAVFINVQLLLSSILHKWSHIQPRAYTVSLWLINNRAAHRPSASFNPLAMSDDLLERLHLTAILYAQAAMSIKGCAAPILLSRMSSSVLRD